MELARHVNSDNLTNSDNLVKFNLQQIGVEAMVERHQFYLEGSTAPQLWPQGDVFLFAGHKYAAKQPGQFMAGAAVYWVLRAFGLRWLAPRTTGPRRRFSP